MMMMILDKMLQVLSRDSVTVSVDAVVYYRVSNPTMVSFLFFCCLLSNANVIMSATFPVDVDRNHEKDGNDNYNDSNDNEKMTITAMTIELSSLYMVPNPTMLILCYHTYKYH